MTGIHWRSRPRPAFTMVELMVVILIIAILVSLISSAVVMAMGKIPEVKTRTEISQLQEALQAFMTDYNLGQPPPSVLHLNEQNPQLSGSFAFLKQVFGKNLGAQGPVDWNGDGTIDGPWVLSGEQCLVFYLGGIPNTLAQAGGAPPECLGFSTNNMNPAFYNPALPGGGKRKGPYYTFESGRLKPIAAQGGFFVYIDPWKTKAGPNYLTLGSSPYAFFSSAGINNGYHIQALSYFKAAPYYVTNLAGVATGQYTNSNTYQIISAGKDGIFGTTGWYPSSGAIGAGADDQANFSSKLLGKGQQ